MWEKIYGQERAKKLLQKAIEDDRIAGSYLLWGDEGVGKDAIALAFAATVNNINESRINPVFHPNVYFICSFPSGKSSDAGDDSPLDKLTADQLEEIKEQLSLKGENFYHKINISGANNIRVSQIRELKRKLSRSADTAGRRVVIISEADRMNEESANAFLKTLEEPNDNITIFLTTSKPGLVLPTIHSRCQEIYCGPLPDETIKAMLRERGHDETEQKIIAAFAQGSLSRMEEFLGDDMTLLRMEITDILRAALRSRAYRTDLAERLDSLIKSNDKKSLETVLGLLSFWFRDVMALASGQKKENLINMDQYEPLNRFAENFGHKDLPAALALMDQALLRLKRNVNPLLLFIDMFLSLRRIFLAA